MTWIIFFKHKITHSFSLLLWLLSKGGIMSDIRIVPFASEDDEAALELEKLCVQGKSLSLRFHRSSFQIRSQLYDHSRIYCAKKGNKLVGIIAGALKSVNLHTQTIRSLYVYDLRVHPDHRKQGIGRKLSTILAKDLGKEADCLYTLIHGQNDRIFSLAKRYFTPSMAIPLTYVVIPVYKRFHANNYKYLYTASNIYKQYLQYNTNMEFLPEFKSNKMKGYMKSILLENVRAGCSIWTIEDILAEQVVRIPFLLKALKALSIPLRPFLRLPSIPKKNEILQSWFLFDLYAENDLGLRNLLRAAINSAYDKEKDYLYILLQNSDLLLTRIKQSGFKLFTFPYYFLAKGKVFPFLNDNIYIDIRDL
jgi:predicted N-acetyltransferase YhbS